VKQQHVTNHKHGQLYCQQTVLLVEVKTVKQIVRMKVTQLQMPNTGRTAGKKSPTVKKINEE